VQRVVISRGEIILFLENYLIFLEGGNKRIQSPAQAGTVFAHVVEMVCCLNHFTYDETIFTDFLARLLV